MSLEGDDVTCARELRTVKKLSTYMAASAAGWLWLPRGAACLIPRQECSSSIMLNWKITGARNYLIANSFLSCWVEKPGPWSGPLSGRKPLEDNQVLPRCCLWIFPLNTALRRCSGRSSVTVPEMLQDPLSRAARARIT